MTPLPPPLGDGGLRIWRLDRERHAATWASGEGAWLAGGRWNSRGRRVVYAALDPATAILEVAVHKTFRTLDADPHVLTSARLMDLGTAHVVTPGEVPDPGWLLPGNPSASQQAFGDRLIENHRVVILPSVVSRQSWNVLLRVEGVGMAVGHLRQEVFALDPRLTSAQS